MKRLLIVITILVLMVSFAGCANESAEDLRTEIKLLKNERNALQNEVVAIKSAITTLSEDKTYMEKISDGSDAKFILTLELKQSHFTLDLGEHLKDEMNSVEFDIAVDKELYDNQNVGEELLKEFRKGSFILYGSIGEWRITVKDKRIEYIDESEGE